MRMRSCIAIAALLLLAFVVRADDAADLHKKGIEALKESQTNPEAIVTAARYFAQAAALYEAQKNEALAVETNSYLYWCKKKMTLADIDAFVKGDAALGERLKILEKAPAPAEAQAWFDRAETFARTHAAEHLLNAIRYFEVADRFKNDDVGRAAMSKSLAELQMIKTPAATGAKPIAEKPVEKPMVPKTRKTVNLLRLVDPPKDTTEGKWSMNNSVLVCEKSNEARLELPYFPPEEYDFKIVFMRTDGDEATVQILSESGRQFLWAIDAFHSKLSAFEAVGGKGVRDNRTGYRSPLITNGKWHTSVVQVRKDSVTAFFDGKEISKWTPELGKLDIFKHWKLRDPKFLGVGQMQGKTAFSTIELTEITGNGKPGR